MGSVSLGGTSTGVDTVGDGVEVVLREAVAVVDTGDDAAVAVNVDELVVDRVTLAYPEPIRRKI